MESKEEDFKKFFQGKFAVSQSNAEMEEFDYIQLKIASKKFYRFNLRSFNIYYAFAILASLALTLSLGIDYLQSKKKMEAELIALKSEMIDKKNIQPPQTARPPVVDRKADSRDTVKKTALSPIKNRALKSGNNIQNRDSDNNKIDSARTMGEINVPKEELQTKKNEPKKTVYIIKQDTIVRYDSIKVKKRK